MTNAPRGTGEVVVPLAVIFRIAAWVRKPPRGQSGGQLHPANRRAAHARNAVKRGQLLVQHGEVRAHEMAGVEVLLDQLAEVGPRLGDHRILQVGAELGIELAVGIVGGDLAQLQPLAEEVFDEPLRLRVLQQTLDFGSQDIRRRAACRRRRASVRRSSGIEFQKKYESRQARAWSSSLPAGST